MGLVTHSPSDTTLTDTGGYPRIPYQGGYAPVELRIPWNPIAAQPQW